MPIDFSDPSHYALAMLPEIVLSLWAMGLLLLDVFQKGSRSEPSSVWIPRLTLVGLALAAAANGWLLTLEESGTAGIVPLDAFRVFVNFILLLGALIPVSDAIQDTGGSQLLADALGAAIEHIPSWAAVGLVMVSAMAVTPFLNNAATVLVMAPVAALLAERLGASMDAFLMAVAIGAACDFLTPIGHQCNTLVMGPGGYRFGDYWRVGLPLEVVIVAVAFPLLLIVWPL